jgi:hypothetical protein
VAVTVVYAKITGVTLLGTSVVSVLFASRRVAEAKRSIKDREILRGNLDLQLEKEAVSVITLQIRELELNLAAFEYTLRAKIEEMRQAFDAHHGMPVAFATSEV